MFKIVLIDARRARLLYHTSSISPTFYKYDNWDWQYNQPKGKIQTYADCLYLGVL